MAMTIPFRRRERFPALQQARRTAETQARQLIETADAEARHLAEIAGTQARHLVEVVEQRLPGRRRTPWYARTWAKSLFGVAAFGVGVALAVTAFMARERMTAAQAEQDATDERGLATTRTEEYDARRAEGDEGDDTVQQASKESFPASDSPVWGSGPDVPVIRQGERKEELPYQQ
jgi:hypothetical protein